MNYNNFIQKLILSPKDLSHKKKLKQTPSHFYHKKWLQLLNKITCFMADKQLISYFNLFCKNKKKNQPFKGYLQSVC